MPVGALAGAGAVAGIGSAAIGSKATKKAAGKAADASLQGTREANALQERIYYNNVGLANPYNQSGLRANALIDNALYGYTPPQANSFSPYMGGGAGVPIPANNNALSPYMGGGAWADPDRDGMALPRTIGQEPFGGSSYGNMQYGQPQPYGPNMAAGPAQPNARSALDHYLSSTDYRFTFDEGMNALNTGLASRGMLQSGAAIKAAINYGQNKARAGYGDWLGRLTGQQQTGLGAMSAVMGVGQNFANTVGQNTMSNAANQANAYLASGAATANLWGNAGNAIGNALGQMGSSYVRRA